MKIYLFDLDGVVVNSEMFTYGIEEKFGINKNFLDNFFINDFSDCLIGKKNLKETIKYYLDNSEWKDGVDNLLNFWFHFENKPNITLLSTIQKLKEKGNICCMVSNQEKHRADFIRNHMELGNYFDEMFFSCDLGTKKPNLDFFQRVYKNLQATYGNIHKKDIYFYDDDIKNIETGKIFGFNSELFSIKSVF